jgi:hypothetical protein
MAKSKKQPETEVDGHPLEAGARPDGEDYSVTASATSTVTTITKVLLRVALGGSQPQNGVRQGLRAGGFRYRRRCRASGRDIIPVR